MLLIKPPNNARQKVAYSVKQEIMKKENYVFCKEMIAFHLKRQAKTMKPSLLHTTWQNKHISLTVAVTKTSDRI